MKAADYRTIVIFDKQIEFFDNLMPVLHEVNCYITTLDVWSGETGKAARKQFKNTLEKNACVKALQELLEQYYVYIPEDLSREINQLHFRCMILANSQVDDATVACTDLLLGLQNNIREYISSAN